MAIAPNTTFVSGAVLTAAQQNAFGFGIVAFQNTTTSSGNITTADTTMITSTSFTALANRYYKVTYFEPSIAWVSGAVLLMTSKIKNGATVLATATSNLVVNLGTEKTETIVCYVSTFAAGATTVIATQATNAGITTAARSATQPAFILVEDIGPA